MRAEVDSRRFRMLIEFSTDEPHVEDTWAGSRLEVGDAVLRAGGPVMRCAATTRDPDSGEVNLQTLRLINSYRGRQESELGVGMNFGVYGAVVEPGRVSVGRPAQGRATHLTGALLDAGRDEGAYGLDTWSSSSVVTPTAPFPASEIPEPASVTWLRGDRDDP